MENKIEKILEQLNDELTVDGFMDSTVSKQAIVKWEIWKITRYNQIIEKVGEEESHTFITAIGKYLLKKYLTYIEDSENKLRIVDRHFLFPNILSLNDYYPNKEDAQKAIDILNETINGTNREDNNSTKKETR